MTPAESLRELLERIGASNGVVVLVSEEELREWPDAAVRTMKKAGLLAPASPACSVVCPGCEQECTMPVHTLPAGNGKAAFFVVCDKRDDINRVEVSADRLRQWRCGMETVGAFVARCLELHTNCPRKADAGLCELGLVMGSKRSQMVCLRTADRLELVAGQNTVPLAELIEFTPEGLSVDVGSVRRMVDAASTTDSRYTPSNVRREARKLDTQALHERWRREYRALKKHKPGMSDVWYSQQIARMDVARGRSAETIRKHMKP